MDDSLNRMAKHDYQPVGSSPAASPLRSWILVALGVVTTVTSFFVYTFSHGNFVSQTTREYEIAPPYALIRSKIPPCAASMPPARGFGTAMMTQLLGHPDVMNGQDLEPLHVSRAPRDLHALAREYWGAALARNQLGGFKVPYSKIDNQPDVWIDVIREYSLRFIYVLRNNHFKLAVGKYPATFLNDSTATAGARFDEEFDEVRINITNFKGLQCTMIKAIDVQAGQNAIIHDVAPCHLKATYEEYLMYPDIVMAQIHDYLGLEHDSAPTMRQKVTPDNMCDTITNMAQVCAALNECKTWHSYIEDPENDCSCKHYTYQSKGGEGNNPLCESNWVKAGCQGVI